MATVNGFLASASIYPSRFVALTSSEPGYVQQATASLPHFGVSQKGTYYAPGTAADTGLAGVAGKVVKVHQEGEIALLKLGGTVAYGDRLTSDASGQGVAIVASTALQYFGAIALHDGASGELINVKIQTGEAVTA